MFSSGQPEMSHNVQQYDKRQFLRVEEAHRCRVHSALFMPLYTSANRHQPFAVFEVVQADTDVVFPVLVHWLKCCLQVQLHTSTSKLLLYLAAALAAVAWLFACHMHLKQSCLLSTPIEASVSSSRHKLQT